MQSNLLCIFCCGAAPGDGAVRLAVLEPLFTQGKSAVFLLKSTCRPQGDSGLSAIGMARSGFQRRLPAKRGPFESASRKGAALPFGERRPISKRRPPLSLVLSMAEGALLPFPVAPHQSRALRAPSPLTPQPHPLPARICKTFPSNPEAAFGQ